MVTLAQSHGLTEGRRMRVDTTVVETNIHYPTDSSLMGDGVRVLTRAMKKITAIAGEVGTKLRDRSRSVKLRVLDIARAARSKAKRSSSAPTVNCSIPPAGWWDRPSDFPVRSPRA
jgi:IS5 family transposase